MSIRAPSVAKKFCRGRRPVNLNRISGKKVLLYFGLLVLAGLVGVTIFARLVLWPLMTEPNPHPLQPATTQSTTQTDG